MTDTDATGGRAELILGIRVGNAPEGLYER
jgi:hypothetical protein